MSMPRSFAPTSTPPARAGPAPSGGEAPDEALGRSQGGFSTKIHLRAEGSQLREELTRREDDLVRTRQELAARQAEAERLKSDIERLKQIDLKLERRK